MSAWGNLVRALRLPWGPSSAAAATPQNMTMSEFSDFVRDSTNYWKTEVSSGNAMSVSSVYACVALIGGAIASMPLHFFRRDAEGNRERYTPDEWWLLNEAPFPCWPAATAWEYAVWSLLLHGDSFWRIHRVNPLSPKIAGFEPLHPSTVTVQRVGDRLRYSVAPQPAQLNSSETVRLDQDDVLHIAGPGFDGLRGQSQIRSALATPGGIALAADEYSYAFFKNSARPDIALTTDSKLDPATIEKLRTQFEERHSGTANAHKPVLLSGGLKLQPITMLSTDAQLLETRKFAVEDICRVFGVPPWMVGHTEKTTSWGSGVEQMSIAFVKYTLQRHLVKFEQEINRKVFRVAGRFCEFATEGLERGDLKSRYEAFRIAAGRAGEPGWMTVNEIRRRENLPPVPDGNSISQAAPAQAQPQPGGSNP